MVTKLASMANDLVNYQCLHRQTASVKKLPRYSPGAGPHLPMTTNLVSMMNYLVNYQCLH